MAKLPMHGTLVLASASQIREKMLRELDLNFMVIRPKVDEDALKNEYAHLPPAEQALQLAKEKARSISGIHADWLVLGADQVCELEGTIFEKPGDEESAKQQLEQLNGKTHFQHSAACICRGGEFIWETVESAELSMRSLNAEEIDAYIRLDQPFHSCGSYKFEAHGKHLFSHITGTDDVIMGLPTLALLNSLYAHNVLKLAA
jgi:septum formation protein